MLTNVTPHGIIYRHLRSAHKYRGVEQLVARRAHNPEVVGSSPASATIKTTVFNSKTVVFLCFFYSFAMGNVNILKDQLSGFPYVFPYAFTAMKNCSIRLALSCFIF